jgi:hypothetical protein
MSLLEAEEKCNYLCMAVVKFLAIYEFLVVYTTLLRQLI